MTYPAWFDLMADPAILARPAAQRVYAHLLQNPRIFYEASDAKAWQIADELKMARDTVNEALDVLIEHGYLLDHGRDERKVRRVSVVIKRAA